MVANESSEDLPAGWTVLFKVLRTGRKVSIYSNLETGKSFLSKDNLFKHIKAESSHPDKPSAAKNDTTNHEENTSFELELEYGKEELPNWLPNGWRVELRTRKSGVLLGKEYKCYIDPSGSGKFYSKLEVTRYLDAIKCKKQARETAENGESSVVEKRKHARKDDTENNKTNVLRKKNHVQQDAAKDDNSSILEKRNGSSMDSEHKICYTVDDQKSEVEDLPSGWIKEIKLRQYSKGIKKDPFYTDPVSGYVFRSKKDVLRYIETGEISKTAIKPKNSLTSAPESTEDEVSTSSEAKRQKLKHPQIKKNLFPGKDGSELKDSKPSKANGSKPTSSKLSPKTNLTVSSESNTLNDTSQKRAQENKKSAENSPQLPKDGSKRLVGKTIPVTDKEPILTPKPNISNGMDFFGTTLEKGCGKETRANSRISTGKKFYDLPPRSSKRLAGDEPEKAANLESGERALISSIKKSRKFEVGENVKPQTVQTKPKTVFAVQSSSRGNKEAVKASLKNNTATSQEEIYKPESRFSDLFGSDPCLEFAFKTLTGELPLDDTSEDGPTLIQSAGKGQASRSKSKKKKDPELPCRSSRRLSAGDALPSEQTCQNGTVSAANLAEPSNKRGKPNIHETGKSQSGRSEPTPPLTHKPKTSEPDLTFSIADYWSDPCLDFAFKTLTGVIPIEDSLVQSYFREQDDGFNDNKDGTGQTLLDFGSSSLFHTNIKSPLEALEKSPAGRLLYCNGVHSQQQHLGGNNTNKKNNSDLKLKVKS